MIEYFTTKKYEVVVVSRYCRTDLQSMCKCDKTETSERHAKFVTFFERYKTRPSFITWDKSGKWVDKKTDSFSIKSLAIFIGSWQWFDSLRKKVLHFISFGHFWLLILFIFKREVYRVRVRFMVFNDTFNNISAILWQSVLLVEETGVPGENHRPATSHS